MDPERIAYEESVKNEVKESVADKRLEELPLGLMLYQARMISVGDLMKALELQKDSGKRIGDIFVDEMKLVSRQWVEALASVQVRAT
jgi:hypothetical protein